MESAASLAHEKAVLNNVSPSSDDDGFYNTTIQGETVNLNGNWPSAQENGIIRMLQDLQGLDWDVTNDCVGMGPCIEFYPESVGNKQGCQVAYIFNGTGNEPPSYYLNATDCS